MLVLSRRQGQRILFPNLGISVQVLPGNSSTVKLGIEAPPDVRILREELRDTGPAQTCRTLAEKQARHEIGGRLNTLAMALHVVEKQMKAGLTADAERTLHEAQEALERLPATMASPPDPDPGPPSIAALLVEDNPNEEALLSSYLRLSGLRVQTVHDGYEALEFLAGHPLPDFLLLDMRLPRFDGPATVAAVRQNPAFRGLRIFAVTGCTPDEFDLPTGGTGVDAWFRKPLNPRRIVEAMSAAVVNN
jgi:carbon storage regulator CsrA